MVLDSITFDAVVAVIGEESVLDGVVPVFVNKVVVEPVILVPNFIVFGRKVILSAVEYTVEGFKDEVP